MKLSTLSILIGGVVALLNLLAIAMPAAFTNWARKFPRNVPLGMLLMAISTGWFVMNLKGESIADFEKAKPILYVLFIGVGIGTCVFVQDFLAARGLAVFLMLLGKLMVDTARWGSESDWRLVITGWAYVMVVAGMWVTISPWRLRAFLEWNTASVGRLRAISAVRLALALFVVALGLTVF